jgi:hypothetical protein
MSPSQGEGRGFDSLPPLKEANMEFSEEGELTPQQGGQIRRARKIREDINRTIDAAALGPIREKEETKQKPQKSEQEQRMKAIEEIEGIISNYKERLKRRSLFKESLDSALYRFPEKIKRASRG